MTGPLLRCPPLLSCEQGSERCWLRGNDWKCGIAVPPPDEDDGRTVVSAPRKGEKSITPG